MENITPMRLVCWKTINGEDRLIVATTANGDQGLYVKVIVGVGKQYWIWNTIPTNRGQVIACDFTGAPVCSANTQVNNDNIWAITVSPEDVLTFEH